MLEWYSLTRRFSVLRNSSGEPIGLYELKSKFAEQRARGSQNQVTEEEEDMILEALGRFHGRSRSRGKQSARRVGDGRGSTAEGEDDDADPVPQTVRSSDSTTTPSLRGTSSMASIASTKGSLSSRRMSNNLFGSGKFRDQAYFLRTANPRRGGRGTGSIAQSESGASMSTVDSARGEHNTSMYSDNQSLRPTTPEDSTYTFGSAPSSPENASTLSKDRSSRSILGEQSDYSSTLSRRLSKALSPDGLKRASLALDQAIRELEEEGDDEIVMERSPIAHVPPNTTIAHVPPSTINGSLSALNTAVESDSSPAVSPSEVETGTALSSDDPVTADDVRGSSPHPGSRTTSPTPRLPGYIPGMPRPMTPRETTLFDTEDLTPSATPRATSPRLPALNTQATPLISQSFTSSMYRSNSNASSYSTNRPVSPATGTTPPLFFNRSMNGRYTPEERQRNGNKQSSPTSDTAESPILGRRRPISPLSGPAYQPMASPPSRPTTPSNVTWNVPVSQNGSPQKTHGRNGSVVGHSRNGSTTSVNDQTEQLERSKSVTRSLRSPALPDSPWVDGGEHRPPSAMSGMELGSPVQGAHSILRSPTPNGTRSPASPTYPDVGGVDDGRTMSRRSSKQAHHSSYTFSLGQPNALLFSPLASSSRSSLESAGSSYHSWDEDHKKDRLYGLFSGLDPDNSPWHDISPDKWAPSTAGTSPYDATETEGVVRKEVGLSKGDFIAIQDKLVGAALTKAATPENRRAGSIRRRRPSTSQSNYSYNGESRAVNSTPQPHPQTQPQSQPQPQPVATSPRAATSEQVARANALLNAVVDSIESPRVRPESLPAEEPTLVVPPVTDIEQSSPMRRNRALAEALFGAEDADVGPAAAPRISIMPDMSSSPEHESPIRPILTPIKPLSPKRSEYLHRLTSSNAAVTPPAHTMPTSPTAPLSPASMPLPMSPIGMPMSPGAMPASPGGLLSPLSPSSNMDPVSLALEVQRRAEAATAALRKSPSIPRMGEGNGGTLPRKRISPDKISAPTLVSASTSVDAIPLRSPTATPTPTLAQQQQASKIGSRFKKLRGTIRAKHPPPAGEEVTPYPLDLRSAGSDATGSSSPSLALRTEPIPIHSAGAEPSRLKPPTPLASPPASAAPGLKGFMARFRKQRNASETHAALQSHASPHHPGYAPMSATSSRPATSSGPSVEHSYGQMPHSAPALQTVFRSTSLMGPPAPSQSPTPKPSQNYLGQHSRAPSQPNSDEDAIKQLFHAAENLGLDQAALNELLARSPSTSSRSTAWTKPSRATSPNDSRKSHIPVIRGRATPESIRSPMSEGRPSVDGFSPRPSVDMKPSGRRSQDAPLALRPRPQQQHQLSQQEAVPNAIVRRTIIFPSDARMSTLDIQAMMRKQTNSRRRASVSSKSSVHDRVPTPPPPHRAVGRRFSTDASPPVPQLPPSLSVQNDSFLAIPNSVEKNGSAYDSLYEMYSGDGRGMIAAESTGGGSSQVQDGIPESGPALEVIEMANGETIWSIVNGLRDDDGESFYDNRASFYSEYSVKDNENVKLFFKEHERKNSRGSVNSFLSRKKPPQQPPQQSRGAARPETKVFFSTSAQIGRLIENLSHGMDAGSFNILPGQGQGASRHAQPGHSTSSSLGSDADMPWTVEERLERMLGSMGAS
ncbi:hypothetical protein LXA43DRAFT_1097318 [Ganoderma leucocontextum]|nr:hypothetical protein LXA43DRAFT_1097318 [Ganoderma leucocontextum]